MQWNKVLPAVRKWIEEATRHCRDSERLRCWAKVRMNWAVIIFNRQTKSLSNCVRWLLSVAWKEMLSMHRETKCTWIFRFDMLFEYWTMPLLHIPGKNVHECSSYRTRHGSRLQADIPERIYSSILKRATGSVVRSCSSNWRQSHITTTNILGLALYVFWEVFFK